MMFNKEKVSIDKLNEEFKNFKSSHGDESLVIIKADKDITHGIVVSVMDIAKANGFNRLAIATEPK